MRTVLNSSADLLAVQEVSLSSEANFVPVHLGIVGPDGWGENGESELPRQSFAAAEVEIRPEIADPSVPWGELRLEPRWLGLDSSDCPVAIQPGRFSGQGADERSRFLEGARFRKEVALVLAWIGANDHVGIHSIFSDVGESVDLGDDYTRVVGRRVPVASGPRIAPNLGASDHDLALRLSQQSVPQWWALELHGSTLASPYETHEHPATGTLQPLLLSGVGEILAGMWISEDQTQRWYVLPDGVDWVSVLDWLGTKGLPALVPNALRRVRSPLFDDPAVQSQSERTLRDAIEALDVEHAARRSRLEAELAAAHTLAEPIRNGLLYEQGDPLVRAVESVLNQAGLATIDLDQEIGTKNADLLVTLGQEHVLVEVKGFGGAAPETAVAALRRHLQTWPQLRPSTPVSGGVLVVSHEIKQSPSVRSAVAYRRPEFVESLQEKVVTALDLFEWWSHEDWQSIRAAFFQQPASPALPADHTPDTVGLTTTKRPLWRRRKRPESEVVT